MILGGRGRLLFACARPLQGMKAPESSFAIQRHIEPIRIEIFNSETSDFFLITITMPQFVLDNS
jgi:hypothetical protein